MQLTISDSVAHRALAFLGAAFGTPSLAVTVSAGDITHLRPAGD